MTTNRLLPYFGDGGQSKYLMTIEDVLREAQRLLKAQGNTKIDLKIEFHEHRYEKTEVHEHIHKYAPLDQPPAESRRYAPEPFLGQEKRAQQDVDPGLLRWQDELRKFETIRQQLWKDKRYRNRYVAMRRGRLIDVDPNKFALVKRMAAQFPEEAFFVAKVQLTDVAVELPSPMLKP